jgi:hypothetical protein
MVAFDNRVDESLTGIAMKTPYIPKYVPPKEAAQSRARLRARLYWTALAIPLAFLLLVFGYSDQAPAFLRNFTIALDRTLGYPILALIGALAR